MNVNDVVKQGNRGGNQYYHAGYSYRVRVGKLNQPGHRNIHVPHDISFTQWYLICRKPGCRFVGMVRILNDNTRVGFSTNDGRGMII